jgi:hypothetical protein
VAARISVVLTPVDELLESVPQQFRGSRITHSISPTNRESFAERIVWKG